MVAFCLPCAKADFFISQPLATSNALYPYFIRAEENMQDFPLKIRYTLFGRVSR
jgi:hypothetical protein